MQALKLVKRFADTKVVGVKRYRHPDENLLADFAPLVTPLRSALQRTELPNNPHLKPEAGGRFLQSIRERPELLSGNCNTIDC